MSAVLQGIPRPYAVLALVFVVVPAIAGLYITGSYFALSDGIYDPSGNAVGRDFAIFWTAAQMAKTGDYARILEVPVFHATLYQLFGSELPHVSWVYPPHMLFSVLPFMHMDYLSGYALWTGGTFAALVFALRLAGVHWGLIAVLALAPSTIVNVIFGHNGFATAALIVAGWALLDRRPWLAGLCFGVLTMKPQMGLLIPVALIALGLWRPFIAAALSTAAIVIFSVIVFGPEVWSAYTEHVLPANRAFMLSQKGVAEWMMPTVYVAAEIMGFDALSRDAIALTCFGITLVVAYLAFRRGGPAEVRFAVLLVLIILATPYAYNYDLTYTSLAVLILAAHTLKSGPTALDAVAAGAVWILPMAVMPLNAWGLPVAPLGFALLAYVLWRRQDRGNAGDNVILRAL